MKSDIHPNYRPVVFKDNKLVMFYTNDLSKTPSTNILYSNSPEAVECVQGLAALRRWTGDKNLHWKVYQVPAPIIVYNLYMNAVDIMDQSRSTNALKWKEKRLSVTILSLIDDLAIHNAYAVYSQLVKERWTA